MRHIYQDLKDGQIELYSVPVAAHRPNKVVSVTRYSIISAGTERTLVEFGHKNLFNKARSQPEKVRQVIDKISTDGLIPTIDAVYNKLNQPLPLGYCNTGIVKQVSEGITNLSIGDRVVSNGPHAEVVSVSSNLCARIPDNVNDDEATFTVLGAVALQGIRLLNPTLGENIVVSGLGILGLMTVQMLIANGCRVLGIDFSPQRLALAKQFGAQVVDLNTGTDSVAAAMAFANGRGVDGVLITASTKSSDPVHQAAQMSRKRGRIVLVGVTGLELNRADFYEKELTFQVSCSYGPGRYDPQYEEKGQDYPFGFVRWTAQRNFEAVLQLMADGKLDVKPLISHRVPIEEAPRAYQLLTEDKSALGILLTYSGQPDLARTVAITPAKASIAKAESKVTIGMIVCQNFLSPQVVRQDYCHCE